MQLQGRRAIITGGTGNLGRVVTARFLAEGARVLVPYHGDESWQALLDVVDAPEGACCGTSADVTDEEQVRAVVEAVVEQFGGVDVLLNLVGGFAFGDKLWETEAATWDKMMDLNLRSAFLCCKHVLPLMREQDHGRIVNVTSKACADLQPGAAAYAVAKGGVITLTRALREELKGRGVTVNAIMPSIIDTPATRRLMPKADFEKWVKPERIAETLVQLCADGLGAVDGSVLRLFGAV